MEWVVQDDTIFAYRKVIGCGCTVHYVAVPVATAKELGLEAVVREMQLQHTKWVSRCPYP